MNKLIKELYLQASFDDYVNSEEALIEKFAELIVQECLLAISKTDVTLEEMSVMVKCHNQVEKHFGVE